MNFPKISLLTLCFFAFSCQSTRREITKYDQTQNWDQVVRVDGYAQIYGMEDGLVNNVWITYPDHRTCYGPNGIKQSVSEAIRPELSFSKDEWMRVTVEVYPDLEKENWRENFHQRDFKRFTETIHRDLRGRDALVRLDFVNHIRSDGECRVVAEGVILEKIIVETPPDPRTRIWLKGIPLSVSTGGQEFQLQDLLLSLKESGESGTAKSQATRLFIQSAAKQNLKLSAAQILELLDMTFHDWRQRKVTPAEEKVIFEFVAHLGPMLSDIENIAPLIEALEQLPNLVGSTRRDLFKALRYVGRG